MDAPGGSVDNGASTVLWDSCAVQLRAQVSEATWNTCFAGATLVTASEQRLVIGVANSVIKERIESRFLSLLRSVLQEVAGRPYEVVIEIVPETATAAVVAMGSVTQPQYLVAESHPGVENTSENVIDITQYRGPFAGSSQAPRVEPRPDSRGDLVLNPRYSFEDFVIGSSNRFAHAAAMSVAETPARSYNPLFIYGDSGLGKSHLLQAIAHYVRQNYPSSRVRYVSTETFVTEFVDAIKTNTTAAFKRRYRDDCDVLLIDDIQFMEGKEGTQEEFFHTFNFLHQSGRQIVISSDRPPKSIPSLEDRLRSRFEWGLITDVQPPELETRLAILRKKADRERVHVPDDVLTFIATHIKENIRELEGALNRVCAWASLNLGPGEVLDPTTVERRILNYLLSSAEPRPITAKVILKATAEMFGFDVEELTGQSRRRPLVTARQVAMYVFRELTEFSYPMIGREFGGRDHTTVIHAVEKIGTQMQESRAIYDQVTELVRIIRTGG